MAALLEAEGLESDDSARSQRRPTPDEQARLRGLLDAGSLVEAHALLGATRCPEGCAVEPDEGCAHGYLALGLRVGLRFGPAAVNHSPALPAEAGRFEPRSEDKRATPIRSVDLASPAHERTGTERRPAPAPLVEPDRVPAEPPRTRGRPEPERAHPRRRPLSRRAKAVAAGVFAVGALLFAEGVVTVLWQEPFSAFMTAQAQDDLDAELAALERQGAPSALPTTLGMPASLLADGARAERASELRSRELREAGRVLGQRTGRGDALGRLSIEAIGASFVFVEGTDGGSLRSGPGHYAGTPLPGQPGTVAIAGHRTTYGAPFRDLDELEPGDEIVTAMPYGRFAWTVQDRRIVDPGEISVLLPLDYDRLVLTACHPLFSASQRIVVLAELDRTRDERG